MASLKNKHNLKIEQDIEKYIKAEAYDHQIRIKDFFEDYDKLRKGYITEDKVSDCSMIFLEVQSSALFPELTQASLELDSVI